jgi:hypothetical protein
MTRFILRAGILLLATTAAYGRADDPPYIQAGRVAKAVGTGVMNEFVFDPVGRRLYGRNGEGVYWVDPRAAGSRFNGPILLRRTGAIEIAPDLGRLYFSKDRDHFGYVNLRTNAPPTTLVGKEWRGGWMVYEPVRKEIYTPTRALGDTMAVYEADTGTLTREITLPGSRVTRLEAVPGKVFFTVEGKFGLHVIDATTHAVRPWPVNGTMVEPGRLEVDPSGRHMITQYERHVVAIDIPSARVIGQLLIPGLDDFAFDPERRLVVLAVHDPPDHPKVRLRTYALNANGFSEVAELKNPEEASAGLTSMNGGFMQAGRHSLFIWSTAPPR